jgi:hypothetical protein
MAEESPGQPSAPAESQTSGIQAVGYGKPPTHSRFRPGRSGNPRGRPKGSRSARALLEQALSAPVTISEGGATRVIEQRAALFKALVAKAIKGDARSAALIVRLMDQFGLGSPVDEPERITVIRRVIVRPGDPGTSQARLDK